MLNPTRRQVLRAAGAGAAALLLSPLRVLADADKQAAGYQLPKLPYPYDALEPYIDAETMKIHHDKHHQAYVDNLNKALADHPELAKKPVEDLLRTIDSVPEAIRQTVINNGGGHANHTMFWEIMGKGGGKPDGDLAKAIDEAFGSFDKFQAQVSDAAVKQFGSGWGWLVMDKGKLAILATPNQNSPFLKGQMPLLGIDVWEHAYYLKYQNRRADYVKAWWNVVNWDTVGARYKVAKG
jgi:superoxide dismutase, Fe-Mn family